MLGLYLLALLHCPMQDSPDASPAPAFEFRGLSSATTREAATGSGFLNRSVRCRQSEWERQPYTHCAASPAIIGQGMAGEPIFDLVLGFDQVSLVKFDLTFFPASSQRLRDAVTAKFGAPCQTEENVLGNRFGAQVPQTITKWCLSDGDLVMESVWPVNLDRAKLTFISGRFAATAPTKPLVDF